MDFKQIDLRLSGRSPVALVRVSIPDFRQRRTAALGVDLPINRTERTATAQLSCLRSRASPAGAFSSSKTRYSGRLA